MTPADERQVDPAWDVGDGARLGPSQKGLRTRASLARKVALLEAAAESPSQAAIVPPYETRAAVRRWADVPQKLWPWSSPEVDSPKGPNADLAMRLEAVLKRLGRRDEPKSSRQPEPGAPEETVVARLTQQVQLLLERIAALEAEVARLIRQSEPK